MIALLFALSALAQDPPVDFRGHLDQARFFLKKGWNTDAQEELERVVESPDGALNTEAWLLLSKLYFAQGEVRRASEAAQRAHTHSLDDAELQAAAGFARWLRSSFGYVQLDTVRPGVETTLDIELTSLIFDADLKRYIQETEARWAAPLPLPAEVALPAGQYMLNGDPVTVVAGETRVVRPAVVSKVPAPVQGTELEVAVGTAGWIGAAPLRAGPHLRVAVSWPLGPLWIGGMVDGTARPYRTRAGGLAWSLGDWTGGVRVGLAQPISERFRIRELIGVRAGAVGGLELPCARDASSFHCAPGASPDLWVYPVGLAVIPGVELALDVRERSGTLDWSWGVRGIVEGAAGRRPRSGDASILFDDGTLSYTVDAASRPFSLLGARVMASVGVAL